MISSPPEEAGHVRGKTLTPESPKPLYHPSPLNIPILEMQIDPLLNEPAPSIYFLLPSYFLNWLFGGVHGWLG